MRFEISEPLPNQLLLREVRPSVAAFSLSEMLVVLGVSSVVLAALGSFYLYANRTFAYLTNHVLMEQQNSYVMDLLSKQVRQARHLTGYSQTSLTLTDFDNGTLQFIYDPVAQTFSRIKAGQTNVLLTSCASLQFQMYTDTITSNAFDVVSTVTNVTQCKVIAVSWTCLRTARNVSNYEPLQCAKILMRNTNGG